MKTSTNFYAAFLRGINVGGNVLLKMEDVRSLFCKAGFMNVKTILASGNVVFESEKKAIVSIALEIEKALKNKVGREIGVIVLSMEKIRKMIAEDPFRNVKITPQTRLYVTFLKEKPQAELKKIQSPDRDFRILQVSDAVIYSTLIVQKEGRSADLMNIIEKKFGKHVTTRNWNTVLKVAKAWEVLIS